MALQERMSAKNHNSSAIARRVALKSRPIVKLIFGIAVTFWVAFESADAQITHGAQGPEEGAIRRQLWLIPTHDRASMMRDPVPWRLKFPTGRWVMHSNGLATILLMIPILAVPALAIFGVPQFAPVVASPLDDDFAYRLWLSRYGRLTQRTRRAISRVIDRRMPHRPRFDLIVLARNESVDLLAETVASLKAQIYPDWSLRIVVGRCNIRA